MVQLLQRQLRVVHARIFSASLSPASSFSLRAFSSAYDGTAVSHLGFSSARYASTASNSEVVPSLSSPKSERAVFKLFTSDCLDFTSISLVAVRRTRRALPPS